MLYTVLIVLLVLALIGGLPVYPYSRDWGYSPVGIIVVILVLWLIFGNRF